MNSPAQVIAQAETLRNQGEAVAAAVLLEACLEQWPQDADLWNNLGLALRHANRPRQSMAAFRRAYALDPDNIWGETNLAFGNLRNPEDPAQTFGTLLDDGAPPTDLAIFCDRFPHTYGFLLAQYTALLRAFPKARLYSFGRRVMEPFAAEQFSQAMPFYAALAPDTASRVTQLLPVIQGPDLTRLTAAKPGFSRPKLAYTQFAMNAGLFLPLWESLRIPFAFTLNPGGGFRLDNPHSDYNLAQVFRSPYFRHVIVTYSRTRDYVMERFQVPAHRVHLIHGTIVQQNILNQHRRPKIRFGQDKDSLDLCFAGLRYSPTGADKGYDRFVTMAGIIAQRFPHTRFHVVGNFTADTVDTTALAGRITFHGQRDQAWMAGFFSGMDAIISPNVSDYLAKGAFDGFPVTTCIEAGMCGVAVFATDPIGLNEALVDGDEIVVIPPEPAAAADVLGEWLASPRRLYALAEAGERRFQQHWGEQAQMPPRIALLKAWLDDEATRCQAGRPE